MGEAGGVGGAQEEDYLGKCQTGPKKGELKMGAAEIRESLCDILNFLDFGPK